MSRADRGPAPEETGPATCSGSPTATRANPGVILTRPGDGLRARRLRHRARRELDELLGHPDPWDLADRGDWWHDTWMDRGLPERERRGREMTRAGWTP